MENHHAINGYINYFDWVIFNSYVSLPEGKTTINHHPVITIFCLVVCDYHFQSWVVNMTWFYPHYRNMEGENDFLEWCIITLW